MKLIKIILTGDKNLKNKIEKVVELKKIESNNNYTIFEGNRKLFKDEEKIIFTEFNNFYKTIKYLKENYDIFKIIILGKAYNIGNIDLKIGDIIIPNTFIKENQKPIFIDYAIGENYNLKDFGLMLSGICLSSQNNYKSKDFKADIKDGDSYDLLKIIKKENLLDISVIIKEVIEENKTNNYKNIINVLDLVL